MAEPRKPNLLARGLAAGAGALAWLAALAGLLFSTYWPYAIPFVIISVGVGFLPWATHRVAAIKEAAPVSVVSPTTAPTPDCAGAAGGRSHGLGFGEAPPETITLVLGTNTMSASLAALRSGHFIPVRIGSGDPFRFYVGLDGKIYVDAYAVDPISGTTIRITKNRIESPGTSAVDYNYSENALEVVDSKGQPFFQVVREHPGRFVIKAVETGTMPGLFIIADDEALKINVPISALRMTPIFVYPSWKYPGCYAS